MKARTIGLKEFVEEFRWFDRCAFLLTTREGGGKILNYDIDKIGDLINQDLDIRMYIFPLEIENGKVVKKEYFTNYVYFDIDRNSEEVKSLLQNLQNFDLIPNFFIATGRHYAFIYKFKESISSLEYEKYQNAFEKYGLKSDHKGNEYNIAIRIPESYNTKTGKQVKWFLLTDKLYSYDEISSKQLPACKIIEILDRNFEYHRYEGWRLMSYVYAMKNEEQEFINKSKLWKKVVVEQTPEYRIQRSKEEITKNEEHFPTCVNISQWDVDKINSTFAYIDLFDKHPCENCPFRNSKLPPFRNVFTGNIQTTKQKFTAGKYEFNENIVKKDDVIITNNFRITKVVRTNWGNKSSILFIWEDEKDSISFDFNNTEHLRSLMSKMNILKEHLLKDILQSYINKLSLQDKIEDVEGFTGYHKKWNIRNVHYHGLIFTDEIAEVEAKGEFEKFKDALREIIKLSIELNHPEIQIAIATSLFSAYRFLDSTQYLENFSTFLVGETGTGKTLSSQIANSLWRHPFKIYRWNSVSPTYIASHLDKCKGFIAIDEFTLSGDENKDLERIDNLYTLLNVSSKKNMKINTTKLDINFIFSAERHVGDKILRNFESTGLSRRLFIVSLYHSQKEAYANFIKILTENYGFIYLLPLEPIEVKLSISMDPLKKHVLEKMLGLYYRLVDFLGIQDTDAEERWIQNLIDTQLNTLTEKTIYLIKQEQERLIKERLANNFYTEVKRININVINAKELATILLHAFSLMPGVTFKTVTSKEKTYGYIELKVSCNNLYSRVRVGEQISQKEVDQARDIALNIIEYIQDPVKKIMARRATIDIINRLLVPNILSPQIKETQESDFI